MGIDYILLGKRIRARRKELKQTQKQLACAVGVSQGYLGNVERGIRKCGLTTLVEITDALNCTPDSLLLDSLNSDCAQKYRSGVKEISAALQEIVDMADRILY